MIGHGFTLFAVLVVAYVGYLAGVSSLGHGRDQRGLGVRFGNDLENGQAWIGGVIPEGDPVALLEIPDISVREVVVEGTSSAQLKRGAGHLRSSPLPGQSGNSIVAARRIAYGGPFRHLDELRKGDEIVATTGQGRVVYIVNEIKEVEPDAPDVIDDTGRNQITLVTSAPEFVASRRLIATARLQGKPRPVPASRATDLREDELGLHGDQSVVLPLLLWAQALMVVAIGAAWLHRRWRRWPAYLITAPVILLLVLLIFDSFTPILPSTL
ncbi:MAG: class D sortase [Acidimicrobiales bacterium]